MKDYKVISVSPGYISGKTYTPENFKEGCILFIPNMHSDYMEKVMLSSGVIAKVGGATAHMSTICREFSIPAVIFPEADNVLKKEGLETIIDAYIGVLYVHTDS